MENKTMKVYRDKEGKVINIGEWDYNIKFDIAKDADGNKIEVEIAKNPLPEGLIESDEEVVTTDAGRFVKSEILQK
jgi:hypothetical protein